MPRLVPLSDDAITQPARLESVDLAAPCPRRSSAWRWLSRYEPSIVNGLSGVRSANNPAEFSGWTIAVQNLAARLSIRFVSAHRPIQAHTEALANAGLLIERLREPAVPDHVVREPPSLRWQRLPLFLHVRAVKR